MAWLGEHPHLALTAFVHVVFIIGIYSLVVKEYDVPPKDVPMQLGIAIETTHGPDDPDEVESGGGGMVSPFPTPQPIPGLTNESDSATNQAAIPQTPRLPDLLIPTPEGRPATLSPIHSHSLGQLMRGDGVEGSGQTGQGGSAGGGLGLRSEIGRGIGVRNNGGSAESESAVDAGLRWLAAHQTREDLWVQSQNRSIPVGFWHPTRYVESARDLQTMQPIRTTLGSVVSSTQEYTLGLTALVTLAFLGAGHKPGEGQYGDELGRAVRWMLLEQDSRGRFGRRNMYNHAIAVFALAECMQLTGDDTLRGPIQRGVDHIVTLQNPDGGWDYTPNMSPRNDTSITSWCMMALKAAQAGGVAVPRIVFVRMIHHFKRMTTADGYTIYADRSEDDYRLGAAMVATSLFCRLSLGAKRDDLDVARQVRIMQGMLPDHTKLESLDHSYYSWYLGTLACFFHGGETWRQWNAAFRPMAVSLQRRDGQFRGSWNPSDRWSWAGGRVYATATMVLALEVYYRYVPEFFVADAKQWQPFWDNDRLYAVLGPEFRDRRPFIPNQPHHR